jgi:hypothetical protein
MPASEPAEPQRVVLRCDVGAAFDRARVKGPLGYLVELRGLGGVVLSPDLLLWRPPTGASSPLPASSRPNGSRVTTSPRSSGGDGAVADQARCVAVIDTLELGGGSADPIRLSAFVSKQNQARLRATLVRPMRTTLVELEYAVLCFDESSSSWYAAFELASAPSSAQINTADGDLQLFVAFDPTLLSESMDLHLYRLELQLIPAGKASLLKLATSPTHRYEIEWVDTY